MSRILIVEDEERIATFVAKGLRASGYVAEITGRGDYALEIIAQGNVDLVLLDVGLPVKGGFDVLEELRGTGNTVPVIMLTAHGGVQDTVRGFDLGADDYIAKPFRFDELLARVKVRMREQTATGENSTLTVGDLMLDLHARRVHVDGVAHDLSAREFALAEELLRHPDQVLSREQLLSRVWGYDYDPGSNVVDVYVRYLRSKLGQSRIETVRGIGYRLTV